MAPVTVVFFIGCQKPAGPSERQEHLSYVFLGFVSRNGFFENEEKKGKLLLKEP